jgi:hypothetical protein
MLLRGVSAVDEVVAAADEGGGVRGEEGHEVRDLLRVSEAAQSMLGGEHRLPSASRFASTRGVWMNPGPTAFTRTPCVPYSSAAFFVRPTTDHSVAG